MKVSFAMHISQGLQSLINDVPNFEMRQLASFLQQLEDISVQILKDKVKLVVFFYQLIQLNDVGMV